MKIWNDLYAPKNLEELPQQKSIKEILNALKNKESLILLHGPTGTGKTTAIHLLAKLLDLEILEMNASNFRDKETIERTLGSFSMQSSLFMKNKLIIMDEVDCFFGRDDRGGLQALLSVLKNSKYPAILIANDIEIKKLKELKKEALIIEFNKPDPNDIYKILEKICKKENVKFSELQLKTLARRVDGDIRAAINDLQVYTILKNELDISNLEDRNPEADIQNALKIILKTKDASLSQRALDNVGMELDECISWIDENIPLEYTKPEELVKAYDALAKADIFRSRIMRRQHWRFLVYQNSLMAAGVALAREAKKPSATTYKRSMVGLMIWQANMKYGKRNSIAKKLSSVVHKSPKHIIKNFEIYKNILAQKELQHELQLSDDEIIYLNR